MSDGKSVGRQLIPVILFPSEKVKNKTSVRWKTAREDLRFKNEMLNSCPNRKQSVLKCDEVTAIAFH